MFNGAGQGTHATNAASKGGGATDIRTSGIEGSTDWQSTLSTRFLVAGGGGGATDTISGMTGGGAGGDGGADGSGGSGTLGQGQSTAEVLGAGGGGYLLMYCPYNIKHKVAAEMEKAGGQLADWNFELRGSSAWKTDENRWDYKQVSVSIPDGNYTFPI